MARQLDMKIGVGDADSAPALTQPVTGEIGGLKIAIGPRGADLRLGGFGPGTALDGGYYQVDLIDETTTAAGYTEGAVAFRLSSPGPNYLHNPDEALDASGAVEELAIFYSFEPQNHTRSQVFSTTGLANLIETLARVVVRLQFVDAQGVVLGSSYPNTNRDMLDVSLNPRRVTVCFSANVVDATTMAIKLYSHIEGESGWTADHNKTVTRNLIKASSDTAFPGWAFGARLDSSGKADRASSADVYGFALMAGPAGSVPDFGSAAVRDTFFDVASGTMNGRDLGVALAPYEPAVKFAKHGAGWDASSGGSLSDASVSHLPVTL